MGYISAKLDDVANFIPARLSGFIVVLGAMVSGKDFKRAYSVMMRDRKKHNSPNFGYPEAAMAGALGIRLGGVGLYFGDILDKPVIGDDINPLEIRVIPVSYYDVHCIDYCDDYFICPSNFNICFDGFYCTILCTLNYSS